jgi:phosphoribosylanthranilate isomerase
MGKIKIKICGLKTPELAYEAAMLGVDYIGLVFHPSSKRYVTLAQAYEIAQAVKLGGAQPVGVFVHHTANDMFAITKATDIQVIQLHGELSRAQHQLLGDDYQRLYACSVSLQGSVNHSELEGLQHCDPLGDYLLLDGPFAGSGQTFLWEQPYSGVFRIGLAGGLNARNVTQGIHTMKPALVDVSSGVENEQGEKTLALIKEFIDHAQ